MKNKLLLGALIASSSALMLSTIALISTTHNIGRQAKGTVNKPEAELAIGKTENEKLDKKPVALLDYLIKKTEKEIEVAENCKENFTNSTGSLDILTYAPPDNVAIMCGKGKGLIKIYFADGRVEIPDGVSLPESARMFWDAVGSSFPEFRQAIISKYEREKKK